MKGELAQGSREHVESLNSLGESTKVKHVNEHTRGAGISVSIPKILHFTYVSQGLRPDQEPFPDYVQQNIAGWKAMQPDWEVKTWDNAAVRQEFPEIVPILAQIKIMSWLSDLLRYHVLERFGGVYIDTDTVAIRSIEPLLTHFGFTVCERPFQNPGPNITMSPDRCRLACNAVIGVKPHHPALQQVIEKA